MHTIIQTSDCMPFIMAAVFFMTFFQEKRGEVEGVAYKIGEFAL